MINLLNFAAVPFNSPIYERMERGREEVREELREEVRMEVMRELQDQVSRFLFTPEEHIRDSSEATRRQSQISRLPFEAKQNEPALTCLVVPGARATNEEDMRGYNGDSDEQTDMSRQPTTSERGRLDADLDEQNPCQPTRSSKVPVAASLICLLLLFSIAKR